MRAIPRLRELTSLVWHPQQGLWNWALTERLRKLPGGKLLGRAVVLVDSLLLAARAFRMQASGPLAETSVLYLDCGVWRDGKQIRLIYEWLGSSVRQLDMIGFEANPYHHEAAMEALSDIPGLELRQVALVGPGQEGSATLYLTRGGEGDKGDSLLRTQGESVEVPAERLSRLLPAAGHHDAVLLRMNIEGAEEFVIQDLLDAGALHRVSGFFGMWDDLAKIDRDRGRAFQVLLDDHGIRPFPFNDRDIEHPFWPVTRNARLSARIRLWAIKRAVKSAILRSTAGPRLHA